MLFQLNITLASLFSIASTHVDLIAGLIPSLFVKGWIFASKTSGYLELTVAQTQP